MTSEESLDIEQLEEELRQLRVKMSEFEHHVLLLKLASNAAPQGQGVGPARSAATPPPLPAAPLIPPATAPVVAAVPAHPGASLLDAKSSMPTSATKPPAMMEPVALELAAPATKAPPQAAAPSAPKARLRSTKTVCCIGLFELLLR